MRVGPSEFGKAASSPCMGIYFQRNSWVSASGSELFPTLLWAQTPNQGVKPVKIAFFRSGLSGRRDPCLKEFYFLSPAIQQRLARFNFDNLDEWSERVWLILALENGAIGVNSTPSRSGGSLMSTWGPQPLPQAHLGLKGSILGRNAQNPVKISKYCEYRWHTGHWVICMV